MGHSVEGDKRFSHPLVRKLEDARARRRRVPVLTKPVRIAESPKKPEPPPIKNALDEVAEEYSGDIISYLELHEIYADFLAKVHNLHKEIKDPNKNFTLLIDNLIFTDGEKKVRTFDPEIAQVFLTTIQESGKTEVIREMHDSAMTSREFQSHMTKKYDPYAEQSREYIKAMVWLGERLR